MASCNFKGGKIKDLGSLSAVLRHNGRADLPAANHSNDDIRGDLTKLNVSYLEGDYDRRLARAKARLREVSPEGGPREGAVLFQLVNVPVPEGIAGDYERCVAWGRMATEVICGILGKENLVSADLHVDEVHTYKDAVTGEERVSREHLQLVFVAAVDYIVHTRPNPAYDKNDKSKGPRRIRSVQPTPGSWHLNGREFSSRANIVRCNDAVQEMSRREFGVAFMDGSKRKSKATVEDLKAESRALQKADAEAEKIIRDAEQEADRIRAGARGARVEADSYAKRTREAADAYAEGIRSEARAVREDADGYSRRTRKKADAEARSRGARLDERERDLAKRESDISDAKAELEAARQETMGALADAKRRREEAEEALEAARSDRAAARSAMQAIWSMVFGRDKVPMPVDAQTFVSQVRGEVRRWIDLTNNMWDELGAISEETRNEVARRRHVENDPAEALARELGLDDEPTM